MKYKRLLSILLCIAMLVTVLPSALAADESLNVRQITKNSTDLTDAESLYNGLLTVNEQVLGTDIENEFKIQLDVTTAENLSEMTVPGDAAVFIMVDKSSSMEQYSPILLDTEALSDAMDTYAQLADISLPTETQYEDGALTEVDAALEALADDEDFTEIAQAAYDCYHRRAWFERKAVLSFLDEYTSADDGARYFALGSFYSKSSLKIDWTKIDEDWESDASVYDVVSDYGANKKGTEAWNSVTSTAALDNSKNTYTNGSGTNIESAYNLATEMFAKEAISSVPTQNCLFILVTDGEPTYYGEKTQMTDEDTYESLGSLANIEALVAASAFETNVVWYGEATLGNSIYKDESTRASYCDNFSGVDDDEMSELGMSEIFDSIATIESVTYPWEVTSEMASYIKYVDAVETEYVPAEAISFQNNTLKWDLTASEPISAEEQDDTTIYHYQLVYNILLDNTLDGFVSEQSYPVNTSAVLDYTFTQKTNAEVTAHTEGSLNFDIPEVKGYLANIELKKTSSGGGALTGAKFSLTGNGKDLTDTSDEGAVSFSALPSGASYTLKEIEAPNGYYLDSTEHTVQISYGLVRFDNAADSLTVINHVIPTGGNNRPKTPDEVIDITEEETPLDEGAVEIPEENTAVEENELLIVDEGVPLGDLPNTGLNGLSASSAITFCLLALSFIALQIPKRKEHDAE